jgi:hypothetical protein
LMHREQLARLALICGRHDLTSLRGNTRRGVAQNGSRKQSARRD